MNRGHGRSRRPATWPPEINQVRESARGQSGLMSPPVAQRIAGREIPDTRGVGPRTAEAIGNDRPCRFDPRHRVRDSETPRPSSRETAMPPCWARDRGGTVAITPSVSNASKDSFAAERTEAGPGSKQVAHRFGPIPHEGPRCDFASRYAGLRHFWGGQ